MTEVTAIRAVGGLLTADLLARLDEDAAIPGLTPAAYGLGTGETLRQAASRTWEHLAGIWAAFRAELDRTDGAHTRLTRDRWLFPMLHELGFEHPAATPAGGITAGEKEFPVSHQTQSTPMHLLGWDVDLDTRTKGMAGAAGAAPQAMLQELLNRSDEHLWAVLTNGRRLRLLRDSTSLIGSAYIEFDLEAIFDGGLFSDFSRLYLLAHRTRFDIQDTDRGPASCWLERWREYAIEQGIPALERLRSNVADAIAMLGTGFLQHPDNTQLRKQLQVGDLAIDDFLRTLLRCTYRLLFWFVAEDRDALHPDGTDTLARQRYTDYFSARRLRAIARRRRGNRQADIWQTTRIILDALGHADGYPKLGITGIGGIFDLGPLDDPIADAALSNNALLDVVRTLSIVTDPKTGTRHPVDFRNLGAEELGGVYELLLELHPRHDPDNHTLTLDSVDGSERKTSGSYYTPTSLVDCLLDTALDPLITTALAAADPEKALLDLTICDPACGSGHFLVAAARRIAKHVAALRTGETEPTPAAVRSAMRDVISRCIYGVDISPMAVEIAKIALWLEALEPGRPLSYLAPNIRVGNALLGATPALLAGGIPNEAFKAIEGDDKKYTSALAKRNKTERQQSLSQGTLFDDTELRRTGLLIARAAEQLRERDSDTSASLADIHVYERRYQDLQTTPEWVRTRTLADAWCAAFVWPKTPEGPPAITHSTLQTLEQHLPAFDTESAAEVEKLAAAYRFFHWHLEFPQIFATPDNSADTESSGWSGGFSCVLGNVPWERVKLQEKEFFAARDPEVASAPNAAARKRLIAELKKDDPTLYDAFTAARRRAEGASHLLRIAGRHPLTGRGDINTYAVFAETGRQIIAPNGRFGIILPTGIATDATTQHFFRDVVQSSTLASIYDFENAKPLFRGVHRSFKFCLLTLTGTAGHETAADFAFFLHDPADLTRPDVRFHLTPEEITLLNPNTGTCPIFRSRRDAEITLGIYRRVPILIKEDDPNGNPWGISFMTMFHMSNDSHLFHTRTQLESDGWTLQGNIFTRGPDRMLPLYEAKMIHHYDHRWATYDPDGTIRDVTLAEKKDPTFAPMPRYWVAEPEVDEQLGNRWPHPWILGWRDITNSTNERTMIASVFPRCAVGNNLPIALTNNLSDAYLLQANLSSLALDYVARMKTGGTHLNFFICEQLPIIPREAYDAPAPWSPTESIGEWIAEAMHALQEKMHGGRYSKIGPVNYNNKTAEQTRAELDVAYFYLYGFSIADVDHALSAFPILARKDLDNYGEFQTQALVQDAFKRLPTH